jgi:hypothetical protein
MLYNRCSAITSRLLRGAAHATRLRAKSRSFTSPPVTVRIDHLRNRPFGLACFLVVPISTFFFLVFFWFVFPPALLSTLIVPKLIREFGQKVFSGIQPTGDVHLGNYLGAIHNWVQLQNAHPNKVLFSIVDLHSLTTSLDRAALEVRSKFLVLVEILWWAYWCAAFNQRTDGGPPRLWHRPRQVHPIQPVESIRALRASLDISLLSADVQT